MMEKYRERALRIIASSLLNSDLSATELRKLSNDFATGAFGTEISLMLDTIALKLSSQGANFDKPDNQHLSEEIYELLQRRRLSRELVLRLMRQVTGGAYGRPTSQKMPVRYLISEFLDRATASERREFVSLIEAATGGDPFLKGIRDR